MGSRRRRRDHAGLVHTWPGAELVSARSIERTLQRQREALAALAGTAAAGLVLLPGGPERLLVSVAACAAVGIVVVSVARVYERDRGDRSADKLIEDGFRFERRSDAVSRAVAERVDRLESDGKRRSLAEALRAHVELDRAPQTPALRYTTATIIRGLGEHSDVVERIATEFERGACDPRAIIEVERLLTMPPAVPPDAEERAELGRRLRRIARLLEAGL
jgi:hypothetical protein